ncbi:tail assembly protein [Dyella sp. GSA-30]|nr:tail assembly protein [Dyella sp. GSA-30]
MQWIQSQFRDARSFFANAHRQGMEFAVFRGKGASRENIGIEQLKEPAGGTITFVPIIKGSKNGGVLQTILGVILVVVGAYISESDGGTTLGIGISMLAGGVVQLLSPQPKLNKNADSAENQPSYVFSGAVNTTAQGNPVPVGYGRMIIGSAVISAAITASDYVPATSGVSSGTPNGNLKKTPYDQDV